MNRCRNRTQVMTEAMHVRRVEVEGGAFPMGRGRLAQRRAAELEAVLDELAFDDLNGAGGPVMVVEPRVLLVRPADQPDVELGVAVELRVVPLVRVV